MSKIMGKDFALSLASVSNIFVQYAYISFSFRSHVLFDFETASCAGISCSDHEALLAIVLGVRLYIPVADRRGSSIWAGLFFFRCRRG